MKTLGVTELRQRAAEVMEELKSDAEPRLILQRSQKVAYLIEADAYESERAELAAARRALFIREVRDAEAEYSAGGSQAFDDVESLIESTRG